VKVVNDIPVEELLASMALGAVEDSKRWFPDAHQIGLNYDIVCLMGEVGEFANIVKKIDRGSLSYNDAVVRHDLAMELTDVFTYLLNIAGKMKLDLFAAYNLKRTENEKRFTDPKAPHLVKLNGGS